MPDLPPVILDTLKTIANKQVDAATEKLLALTKLAGEAQSKLDMLYQYRQDYLRRLAHDMEAGMGAKALENFRNFLRKLDEAILGQQEIADATKHQLSIQRAIWQESQKKKLSYEVLSDQSERRSHQRELKQDQKTMDEHAMRTIKFHRQ